MVGGKAVKEVKAVGLSRFLDRGSVEFGGICSTSLISFSFRTTEPAPIIRVRSSFGHV